MRAHPAITRSAAHQAGSQRVMLLLVRGEGRQTHEKEADSAARRMVVAAQALCTLCTHAHTHSAAPVQTQPSGRKSAQAMPPSLADLLVKAAPRPELVRTKDGGACLALALHCERCAGVGGRRAGCAAAWPSSPPGPPQREGCSSSSITSTSTTSTSSSSSSSSRTRADTPPPPPAPLTHAPPPRSGLLVQDGFEPLDAKGRARPGSWAPPADWNGRFEHEWVFSYARTGAARHFRLHCSLQAQTGRMFIHARCGHNIGATPSPRAGGPTFRSTGCLQPALPSPRRHPPRSELDSDGMPAKENIQVMGLQLANYVPDLSKCAGASWEGERERAGGRLGARWQCA